MKKIVYLVIFIVVVSLANIGCAQVQSQTGKSVAVQSISAETAKKRLDVEKGIILLDVRTVAENNDQRIPGSVLIPVEEINSLAPEILKDKEAVIFVYCRSGSRSTKAAQALAKMSYTNVHNLGGINNWPYQTESGAGAK